MIAYGRVVEVQSARRLVIQVDSDDWSEDWNASQALRVVVQTSTPHEPDYPKPQQQPAEDPGIAGSHLAEARSAMVIALTATAETPGLTSQVQRLGHILGAIDEALRHDQVLASMADDDEEEEKSCGTR